jgi:outer membrane protein TolC
MMRAMRALCLFLCAVSCAAAVRAQSGAPLQLSLQEAIQRGLKANLGVLVSAERVAESEGALERKTSAALLPRVTAQSYANVQNRNLRAFGMTLPGMAEMVGPFSNYYLGFSAQQNIVDLAARRAVKATALAVDATKDDQRQTRNQIARSVAAYYLDAQAAAARASAAQTRVNDAEALYQLAKDRHEAGAATGVDLLRAQVRLANDRQTWLVARNRARQTVIALARNIGLDPGQAIELTDRLEYRAEAAGAPESLIEKALAVRADLRSFAAQRESLQAQIEANRARFYPKFSVMGSFGGLGRSVGAMQGVGLLQGQVDFTLFDRDRNGELRELTAKLRALDGKIADLRRGVAQEVREALLNLDSAAEEVEVSKEGQQLARRELELSRDRFEAGATNNIEVITAQDALERAEENSITAISLHLNAKFALAQALGEADQSGPLTAASQSSGKE